MINTEVPPLGGEDPAARPPRTRASEAIGTRIKEDLGFSGNLDVVMKIPVSVKVVLGSTSMPVSSLLKLGRGAVIPLDRRVGDPVEVVVNDHVVARGEVVVISEEGSRFGISLTEIVGMGPQDKSGAA